MKLRPYLALLIGSLALGLALALVEWRQANPPWAAYQPNSPVRTLIPTISNQPELCLTCHFGIEEISASHPADVFGCVSCHGGDRLAVTESLAHEGLLGPGGNPADLSVVEQTCGSSDCHGGDLLSNRNHIVRVQHSLQATYAGAIGAVLQANGVLAAPQGVYAIQSADYGAPNALPSLDAFEPGNFNHPALTAFSENCLGCHLSAQPIAATNFYRGTGCAACHTPYAADGLYAGDDPTLNKTEPGRPAAHSLTLLMPSTQCAHCHARGDYSLDNLTFTPRSPDPVNNVHGNNYQPHPNSKPTVCERELDCIDCHNAAEAMGDGYLYPNIQSSPLVECRTCHGTLESSPPLIALTDLNDPAFRRDALNPNYSLQLGDTVVQAPNGEPLGAVRWADDRLVLTSRLTGQTFLVPQVQGSACTQTTAQQDANTCRECHASP